jgi:O-antigen ligase
VKTVTALGLWLALVWALAMVWTNEPWAALVPAGFLFCLSAVFGIVWSIRARWRPRSWVLIPVLLAPLAGVAQLLAATTADPFNTAVTTLRFGSVACAFLLGLYAFDVRRAGHLFRVLVVILSTALAAFAIVQLAAGNGKIYWVIDPSATASVMGPFSNRDNYSGFIALVLPLALWEAVRSSRSAWMYGVPAGLMYASVIAGQSRAGWLLTTMEIIAVLLPALLARRHIGTGAKARAAVAIVLIAIFSMFVGWAELFQRFDEKDPYGQERRDLLKTCALMIHDRPLTGFGLGTWPIVYTHYIVRDEGLPTDHAHNDWMQWACDGGILFAVLLLIPTVHGCWLALVRYPWGLGVFAVTLHALVDFPLQRYATLLCFFLILAALEAREAMQSDSGHGASGVRSQQEAEAPA